MSPVDYELASKALKSGLDKVITAEPDITQYDTVVGDGDCGIGLKRGAEGKNDLEQRLKAFD